VSEASLLAVGAGGCPQLRRLTLSTVSSDGQVAHEQPLNRAAARRLLARRPAIMVHANAQQVTDRRR
jgi:hypothetical protein